MNRLFSKFLTRFRSAEQGAAIVEFGLIAPVLAILFMGIAATGLLIAKYDQMHTAVSTGAQYVMAGGNSTESIRQVTVAAWKGAGANASVTVERVCRCGATAGDCSTLCADGNAPQAFFTISSQDTVDTGFSRTPISAREEVRTR